jgi:hypothetical protein
MCGQRKYRKYRPHPGMHRREAMICRQDKPLTAPITYPDSLFSCTCTVGRDPGSLRQSNGPLRSWFPAAIANSAPIARGIPRNAKKIRFTVLRVGHIGAGTELSLLQGIVCTRSSSTGVGQLQLRHDEARSAKRRFDRRRQGLSTVHPSHHCGKV